VNCPITVLALVNPTVDPSIILREDSGFVVQLQSDKVLVGQDQVTFNFIPKGVNNSSQ